MNKKNIILSLIISLLIITILFLPKVTKAQGAFQCQWQTLNNVTGCLPISIGCTSGYQFDPYQCYLDSNGKPKTQSACGGTFSCITQEEFNKKYPFVPGTNPEQPFPPGITPKEDTGVFELPCGTTTVGQPSNNTKCPTNCPATLIDISRNTWQCKQKENSPDVLGVCPSGKKGINTAIGCIPIEDSNELISFFLRWGLGIAGGIAFLLILVAGFQIMTSRGDPNRLKAGQELLTSAIAGIILLIFSIFILRFIGVNILNIKLFGGS